MGGKGGKGGKGGNGGTNTFNVVMTGNQPAGGKHKNKNKKGKEDTPTTSNKAKGCFVQQRIVWVPIPKYKYVDVPMAEPTFPDKMKMKGKSMGKMKEVSISSYSSSGNYGY